MLPGMWGHPGPGIEPIPLALQGGFLTTGPPGKPYVLLLLFFCIIFFILFFCCSHPPPGRRGGGACMHRTRPRPTQRPPGSPLPMAEVTVNVTRHVFFGIIFKCLFYNNYRYTRSCKESAKLPLILHLVFPNGFIYIYITIIQYQTGN